MELQDLDWQTVFQFQQVLRYHSNVLAMKLDCQRNWAQVTKFGVKPLILTWIRAHRAPKHEKMCWLPKYYCTSDSKVFQTFGSRIDKIMTALKYRKVKRMTEKMEEEKWWFGTPWWTKRADILSLCRRRYYLSTKQCYKYNTYSYTSTTKYWLVNPKK